MCRFLAYRGEPLLLESLVSAPAHSLIHQSLHATEAKTETNGDGFGIGWYGERPTPGLYREVHPAWSDENLRSLCAQVRAGLFFAHVRAATGTATTRANCHPFAAGRWLLMHNGQVGGWGQVRRRVEAMIPDSLYSLRQGSTDSEAILLAAMAAGMEDDPVLAISRTLGAILGLMLAAGVREPLRFTAALSDGERVWAFRWSSDNRTPTLYWREDARGLVVVSEPIDERHEDWQVVPPGHCLMAAPGEKVMLAPMPDVAQFADEAVATA
jgi:predicted glutamine amidotransferase